MRYDKWLEQYIDKQLGEKTVEEKYYCFDVPVVYDTERLKEITEQELKMERKNRK